MYKSLILQIRVSFDKIIDRGCLSESHHSRWLVLHQGLRCWLCANLCSRVIHSVGGALCCLYGWCTSPFPLCSASMMLMKRRVWFRCPTFSDLLIISYLKVYLSFKKICEKIKRGTEYPCISLPYVFCVICFFDSNILNCVISSPYDVYFDFYKAPPPRRLKVINSTFRYWFVIVYHITIYNLNFPAPYFIRGANCCLFVNISLFGTIDKINYIFYQCYNALVLVFIEVIDFM